MEFKLSEDYIELMKLLKMVGLCETGGMAGMVITEGLVRVNGQVEQRKRCKLRNGDVVEYDGKKIDIL